MEWANRLRHGREWPQWNASFYTGGRNEEAPWLRLDLRQKRNEDMDQAFPTVPEVASATMTEVAEAARDQYDNVLVRCVEIRFCPSQLPRVGFSLALMLR